MKLKSLALSVLSAGILMSCGGEKKEENHGATTPAPEEKVETGLSGKFTADAAASKVAWEGHTSGVSVYGHHGEIAVSEGSLELENDLVTGGSITIDMATIAPLDSGYSEEHPKEALVGHLANGDFFLVDSFPTSTFVIKSMAADVITGDLTIRGITHEETVTGVTVSTTEAGVTAAGKLVFDRQKYDVSWAHYLEDVLLADEITLDISIVANK